MLDKQKRIDELKSEIKELKILVNRYNAKEKAVKIVLNGGYGCFGNVYFRWYDKTIVEGITATGQVAIKYITNKLNDFINNYAGLDEFTDHIPSSDTDSTIGSTKIHVNNDLICIGDYYDSLPDDFIKKDDINRNYIKRVNSNDLTYSVGKDSSLNQNKIVYVMRHFVKKNMFEVLLNDTSVVITEDHSVIVKLKSNGNIMSIKPKDLNNNDHLLISLDYTRDIELDFGDEFVVRDLGIQELDVYDIEVENDHNFFGNGICIHNSVYVVVEEVLKKMFGENYQCDNLADVMVDLAENQMQPYISDQYLALSQYLNASENKLDMKRECIVDGFMIRAKKNYIMKVLDNEGVRYADPYYKMMGVEVVKTSTPAVVREHLKEAFILVLEKRNEKELREYVREFKKKFMSLPIQQIATPSRITDISKYQEDGYKHKSGVTIPIHVNGSITHNRLVNELKLSSKYEYIRNASNIRYILLKEPNPLKTHVISFVTEFPPEFNLEKYIDKEAQFEKVFISPLTSFMIYNGWTLKENTLLDLFGTTSDDIVESNVALKTKMLNKNINKALKKKVPVTKTSLF